MRRVLFIIQDGWGIAPPGPGNYIDMANTPFFDDIIKTCPHSKVLASGNAVGLPEGAQGTSEVGHLHMGAGRVVWQMYELVNRAIADGSLKKNQVILASMEHAKRHKSTFHLLGMCSDEGVHSHVNHLLALLEMAKEQGLTDVQVDFIADGRDVQERSAEKYARIVDEKIKELGVGRIGSIVGRYFAMDRDLNWDRTKKAYDMLVHGTGDKAKDVFDAIAQAYARFDARTDDKGDKTDYYIEPTVLEGFKPIRDKDSVFFFNFRTDRPRQLTTAFTKEGFDKFDVKDKPKILYTTLSQYDPKYTCPFVYKFEIINNNLGQIVANAGLKQIRIAETEKYAHVTFFFNSQVETPLPGEDRALVPSPKETSYDQKPEMAAFEIADTVVEKVNEGKYDFIVVNFANCDLVGHSAVKEAIIKCVEAVDTCTKKIVEAGLAADYTCYITADHGSAEEKLYPDGAPMPAHSCNPVNAIIVSNDEELKSVSMHDGGHKDTAPTVLDIMGLEKPKEMTGSSLMDH